jgi:hypothetical protein
MIAHTCSYLIILYACNYPQYLPVWGGGRRHGGGGGGIRVTPNNVTLTIINFEGLIFSADCRESRDVSFWTMCKSWGWFPEKLRRKHVCHIALLKLLVICDPRIPQAVLVWPDPLRPGLVFIITFRGGGNCPKDLKMVWCSKTVGTEMYRNLFISNFLREKD